MRLSSLAAVRENNWTWNNPRTDGSFVSVAAFADPIVRNGLGEIVEPLFVVTPERTESGEGFPNNPFNPVPIPGAVWLLGSGLIGLAGARRKFKK